MFADLSELATESDVEQKLIWPFLTSKYPSGLGFAAAELSTKLSNRRLAIDKGQSPKLYYPDYIGIIAGFPVLIVEAKAIGESIGEAFREARLYAQELNALLPHGTNSCLRVIACNGEQMQAGHIDSIEPAFSIDHLEMHSGNLRYASLVDAFRRETFQDNVDDIRSKIRKSTYQRPVKLVGGESFQAEELAQNTFGATIAGDYGHVFNPRTRVDRERIAQHAYIGSLRRQRYVEPIDRVIRNSVAPAARPIKAIKDTTKPEEVTKQLKRHRKLENEIMLLIGSVGAGKSTFVDYLSYVALPQDIRDATVWIRLNLNLAPLGREKLQTWTAEAAVSEFKTNFPDIDFDELSVLQQVFTHKLTALKKGGLSLLDPESAEYRIRIADTISALQSDNLEMAKGIASLVCSGPNRLLVIVLDNCDKRTRDEQLEIFQLAQWLQDQFQCLVILPIRDVTFDLHRHEPPLDTALKQYTFRIEPPQFSDVLQARVRLALEEMSTSSSSQSLRTITFQLPNNMRVSYPAKDQAHYLASILRSLYAHDRFVRQVMTGLAGRDVRRALEIFLDFCMSGHIGEDEIYKIRFFEGQHVLPLSLVARVLLRMRRRFYDGKISHLKNIVQCNPEDKYPDHFVRVSALHWLERRLKERGPAGVEGFHRTGELVADLVMIGHDANRVREELEFLAREGCILVEHLRPENITEDDLLKISSSGVVHLQLMTNPEYMAACAEDTWISDEQLCSRIADRLSAGVQDHYSPVTTAQNSSEFAAYLRCRAAELHRRPELFLASDKSEQLAGLVEAESTITIAAVGLPERFYVGNIPYQANEKDVKKVFENAGVELKRIDIPQNMDSSGNRGYCFVEPASEEGILLALKLNRHISLGGRTLSINEAQPSRNELYMDNSTKDVATLRKRLYVGNLPYSIDETGLRALFASHNITPVDLHVPTHRETGKPQGFGFVEMDSFEAATTAMGTLNNLEVGGRRLNVRYADSDRPMPRT